MKQATQVRFEVSGANRDELEREAWAKVEAFFGHVNVEMKVDASPIEFAFRDGIAHWRATVWVKEET